jgi:competence protein ComEA
MFDRVRRRGPGHGQTAGDRLRLLAARAPLADPRDLAADGPAAPSERTPHDRDDWDWIDDTEDEPAELRSAPGAFVGQWLPAGVRTWPGRRRLVVAASVALVVALGVAVAMIFARPDREVPPDLPALPPVRRSIAPNGGSIVVSVVGRVARQGLATLPEGSRVDDAVRAAGGVLPGADLLGLNLARRLTDGEQIYVGVPAPPELDAAPSRAGRPAKIDLNTATLAELDSLPGVGEVTAQRIIERRTQRGRFTAVEQLREIDGIGEARFARLRELVTVR